MLPIFRLIPVGGVLLAIAILLLAIDPPPATSPSARVALAIAPARGALIDRGEHPEWRQFLILAALRRAGEVERLRDLRDTVIRPEPLAQKPVPLIAPPQAAAPVVAIAPKIAGAVAAKPERTPSAPTQMASITPATLPDARPIAAAAPPLENAAATAAPAATPETNGSRSESAATAATKPAAAATAVAALAETPAPYDDSDVTGSIAPDNHTTTMPVGIGEASSVELLLTLPRERPPVLRRLDIRRARGGRSEQRRVHHVARAKSGKATKPGPDELPPGLNIFALLFKAFEPDGSFQQTKPQAKPPISTQPDKNRPAE